MMREWVLAISKAKRALMEKQRPGVASAARAWRVLHMRPRITWMLTAGAAERSSVLCGRLASEAPDGGAAGLGTAGSIRRLPSSVRATRGRMILRVQQC